MTIHKIEIPEGKMFLDTGEHDGFSGVVFNHAGEISHFVVTEKTDKVFTADHTLIDRTTEEGLKYSLLPVTELEEYKGILPLKLSKFIASSFTYDSSPYKQVPWREQIDKAVHPAKNRDEARKMLINFLEKDTNELEQSNNFECMSPAMQKELLQHELALRGNPDPNPGEDKSPPRTT